MRLSQLFSQSAAVGSPNATRHIAGETKIQQFMMRFSGYLRRFRWLIFSGWLLALIPAVYLAAQSGHLTGGGFEVAGQVTPQKTG